jgi:hypothetical protein
LKKELDLKKRVELAIKMNDLLVTDGAVIPLINRRTPNAKVKALKGPTFNTFDSEHLEYRLLEQVASTAMQGMDIAIPCMSLFSVSSW